MELIYLYIRKYENIFENVEFNFSSNYIAAIENNQLLIEDNRKAVKKYYGDNVNSVVMFLGQNGMGKSTLLDILGINRDDRCTDTYMRQNDKLKTKSSYFLLYHLYEDYFAFEFVDDSFLEGDGKLTNVDMQYENVQGALYKVPMGNIFKLENGVFKYSGNIMLKWLKEHDCRNKIEYAYIVSDKYNNRVSNKFREYCDEYTFERRYYIEGNSYEHLYKCFIYLGEMSNEMLQEKNISIRNIIKVNDHMLDDNKEKGDYLYERKTELDKLFDLKSNIQIEMENKFAKEEPPKDTRRMKEKFLQTFYAEAIEYYFLEQLVGWSEVERIKFDIEASIPSLDDIRKEISSFDTKFKNDVVNGLSTIASFRYEYALLLYTIENHRDTNGNIDLKSVLLYTLNRVEVAASGTINIVDKKAMMEIISLLEELPEHYFESKRKINIKCDVEEPDEKIIELFKMYDLYFRIRNYEHGSNCISKLLSIELPKMSEGQRVFLDIVSKAVSAIYTVEPGDTLVLLIDEPDRALHPELARRFLDTLLESVNECEDRNIQIVISSHSPFIVTDVLPENVYGIDIENGKRIIVNNKETYATNIYYLLMDSFMLENTFGEYSHKQIKKIMELLNDSGEIDTEQMEWIRKIIDRIGEKTVKKKVFELYYEHDDFKSRLVEELASETNHTKLIRIKEILESND